MYFKICDETGYCDKLYVMTVNFFPSNNILLRTL